MNRPRIVGVLSAVIGSTAGFLVLSRWRLAGTITGAIVVPVIYTIVSHCSHESLERMGKWARCRVGRGDVSIPAEAEPTESEPGEPVTAASQTVRLTGRRLQWSAATLAFMAFAVSVYSLSQSEPGTTILREKVVQTVTVTTDLSTLPGTRSYASNVSPAAGLPDSQDASTTTTATPGQGDPPATTLSTVAGPGDGQVTTTSLP